MEETKIKLSAFCPKGSECEDKENCNYSNHPIDMCDPAELNDCLSCQ